MTSRVVFITHHRLPQTSLTPGLSRSAVASLACQALRDRLTRDTSAAGRVVRRLGRDLEQCLRLAVDVAGRIVVTALADQFLTSRVFMVSHVVLQPHMCRFRRLSAPQIGSSDFELPTKELGPTPSSS